VCFEPSSSPAVLTSNLILHSNVFLGLAYDKLNRTNESEQAYLAATRIKDNDRTAWQGLITLYDRLGGPKLGAYREAVVKLGKILADWYGLVYQT